MELFDLVLALPIILLGAIVLILSFRKDEIYWKEIPVRGVTKEATAILEQAKKSRLSVKATNSVLHMQNDLQELSEELGTEEDPEFKEASQKLVASELRKQERTQSSSKASKAKKSRSRKPTTTEEKSPEERSKNQTS